MRTTAQHVAASLANFLATGNFHARNFPEPFTGKTACKLFCVLPPNGIGKSGMQLADADIAELLRAGWGLGFKVPLTDAQVVDVIYYLRWPNI
jgi:hypothetical protein